MVPSYMASKEERMDRFDQTEALMERFAQTQELDLQRLEDPQARVDFLKTLSAETFMDFLAVVNSKLRGTFERWRRHLEGKVHGGVVMDGFKASPDLEPPQNQVGIFSELFHQMQQELTVETLDVWAVKLYSALIFLHMFPDANGRVAQQVFSFMETGKMTSRENMSASPSLLKEYGNQLNMSAIETMLEEHGCTRFKYKNIGGLKLTSTYVCDERPGFGTHKELGLSGRLKYMAAKEAGILGTRAKNGDVESVAVSFGDGLIIGFGENPDENGYGEYYEIQAQPWTAAEHLQFAETYAQIRKEWFWVAQEVAERGNPLSSLWIEVGMKMPNRFFFKLREIMKMMIAIQKNQIGQVRTVMDENYYAASEPEEAREQFIEKLKVAVNQHPELVHRVKQYVESQGL